MQKCKNEKIKKMKNKKFKKTEKLKKLKNNVMKPKLEKRQMWKDIKVTHEKCNMNILYSSRILLSSFLRYFFRFFVFLNFRFFQFYFYLSADDFSFCLVLKVFSHRVISCNYLRLIFLIISSFCLMIFIWYYFLLFLLIVSCYDSV